MDERDDRSSTRRLSVGDVRPGRHAAEQRDELAALHVCCLRSKGLHPTNPLGGNNPLCITTNLPDMSKMGHSPPAVPRLITRRCRLCPVCDQGCTAMHHVAKCQQRIFAHQSITSSERACSGAGILIFKLCAALRLITSWKVVGCITGRSAGLSPFRIRPA